MTPNQLQKLLDSAGLTQMGAAKELGVSPRHMRRYIAGEYDVPRMLIYALRWMILLKNDPKVAFGESKTSKRVA